jgi:hypothetical protein
MSELEQIKEIINNSIDAAEKDEYRGFTYMNTYEIANSEKTVRYVFKKLYRLYFLKTETVRNGTTRLIPMADQLFNTEEEAMQYIADNYGVYTYTFTIIPIIQKVKESEYNANR